MKAASLARAPASLRSALLAALLVTGCNLEETPTAPDPGDAGIPAVGSFRASVDTLAGTVALSWEASAHLDRAAYLVYRWIDQPGGSDTAMLVGHPEDTAFLDSLPEARGADGLRLRYQVRVLDQAERVGLGSSVLRLHLPPASSILTGAGLTVTGTDHDLGQVGKPIRLTLTYRNPGRRVREIAWTVEGMAGLDRATRPSAHQGSDTLSFVPTGPCGIDIQVVLTDDGGGIQRTGLGIQVADLRHLAPKQSDHNFSHIGPFFSRVAGDRIVYFGANGYAPRIYQRASNRWTDGPVLPGMGWGYSTLAAGSEYYAYGSGLYAYDFRLDEWESRRTPPSANGYAAALDGRMHFLPGAQGDKDSVPLWEYDPDADRWIAGLRIPPFRPAAAPNGARFQVGALVPYGGKLYAIRNGWSTGSVQALLEDAGMAVIDTRAGTVEFTGGPPSAASSYSGTSSRIARILTGGSRLRILNYQGQVHVYDPETGAWRKEWDLASSFHSTSYAHETADRGDTLYIYNRPYREGQIQEVVAVDLVTGRKSRILGAYPDLGYGAELTVADGNLYIHGRTGVFIAYRLP